MNLFLKYLTSKTVLVGLALTLLGIVQGGLGYLTIDPDNAYMLNLGIGALLALGKVAQVKLANSELPNLGK